MDYRASDFPSGRASWSHSAMETYTKCPHLYYLYYLAKDVPRPQMGRFDKQVGVVTHLVLEDYYARAVTDGKQEGTHPAELGPVRPYLDRYWNNYFQSIGVPKIAGLIREWLTDQDLLYARADKDYIGNDAIRNAKGEAPKVPAMTTAWKDAAKALGLPERKTAIDGTVAKLDSGYLGISIIDVFQESFKILENYAHPSDIGEIEVLEKQLSGVRYPTTGKALTGKIDLIGRTADGFRVIVDHKSAARTHRDPVKVSFSEQLLLYGWADYQMTGRIPEYIAINFLRSNTLVAGFFDMAEAEDALARREQIIMAILRGVFPRRGPVEFGSPCYNENTKNRCAYLQKCYPKFAEHVQEN